MASVDSGRISVTPSSIESSTDVVTSTVCSVEGGGISVSATGTATGSNEADGKSVTGSSVVISSCSSPSDESVAVDSSGDNATGDADELPTAVSSAGLVKPGVVAAVVSAWGGADDTVVLGKVVVLAMVVVPISGVVVGLRVVEVDWVMSKIIAAAVVMVVVVVIVVVTGVVVVVTLTTSSTGEKEEGKSVPIEGCWVVAFNVVCVASVVLLGWTDGLAKSVDRGVEAKISAKVGFVTTPTVVDETVVVVGGAAEVSVTPKVGAAEEAVVVVVKSAKMLGCCDVVIVNKGDTGASGGSELEKPKSLAPLNPSVVVGGKSITESDGAQHEPK